MELVRLAWTHGDTEDGGEIERRFDSMWPGLRVSAEQPSCAFFLPEF